MVHVSSSWRLCRRQVEDGWINTTGYVEPYYPTFIIFNVLGHRGIVVIYHFICTYIYMTLEWMKLLVTF
jgi:hypothetical protein